MYLWKQVQLQELDGLANRSKQEIIKDIESEKVVKRPILKGLKN